MFLGALTRHTPQTLHGTTSSRTRNRNTQRNRFVDVMRSDNIVQAPQQILNGMLIEKSLAWLVTNVCPTTRQIYAIPTRGSMKHASGSNTSFGHVYEYPTDGTENEICVSPSTEMHAACG